MFAYTLDLQTYVGVFVTHGKVINWTPTQETNKAHTFIKDRKEI